MQSQDEVDGVGPALRTRARIEAKKPYHSPSLTVYGDMRQLTLKKAGQACDPSHAHGGTKMGASPPPCGGDPGS